RFRQKQPAALVPKAPDRMQLPIRHGPSEMHRERDSQDEHVSHAGVDGKEGRVIHHPEVHRAVHGGGGGRKPPGGGPPPPRLSVGDRDAGAKPLRDRRGGVKPLEFAIVLCVAHCFSTTNASQGPTLSRREWISPPPPPPAQMT